MPDLNAVKKAIVANLEVGDVPVGLHTFDELVELRIRGAAKRAPNMFIKPTVKLPLLDVLAVVMAKAGIMGPIILSLLRDAAREAADDVKKRTVGEYIETTKKAIRTVQDELIDGLPKMEKPGLFTGQVEVELVKVSQGESR